MALASDLTGWAVGYAVGALVVVIVAAVLLTIIFAARRIASVAEDATESLALTRARTEALWELQATNRVASDLLEGAREARSALGGDRVGDPASRREAESREAQQSKMHNLPPGPHIDPEHGR